MPWIRTISHKDAIDDLRQVYDEVVSKRGKLSNIMRIQSLNPAVMRSHMVMYMDIMFGRSELRRAEREMIGTIVSVENNCSYCTTHHAEALNAYWKDRERVAALVNGEYDNAEIDTRFKAMIAYAIVLTDNPAAVSEKDIQDLREQGLSDKAILDLNLIVAYFNFVNRLAEGLGVEFDENELAGYKY